MIRPAHPNEFPFLTQLWLASSILCHPFVNPIFWKLQAEAMCHNYLPVSETYCFYEEGNPEPLAFASMEDNFLAALFVQPGWEGKGIGSKLLAHCQSLKSYLLLTVYQKNSMAYDFYIKHHFIPIGKQVEPITKEVEILMQFTPTELSLSSPQAEVVILPKS